MKNEVGFLLQYLNPHVLYSSLKMKVPIKVKKKDFKNLVKRFTGIFFIPFININPARMAG